MLSLYSRATRVLRRFGPGVGDQALSSLTNFGLSIIVARSVSTRQLGAFGLVFSMYLLLLGVSRLFSTDPLLIRFSACSDSEWREGARAAVGTAATLGVVLGLMTILGGLVVGGVSGMTFVALGATLPGLLVQDAYRLAFFAKGRGYQALLNDLAWAVAMVPLFAVALLSELDSAPWLAAAWGLAAAIAAGVGIIQAGFGPAPRLVLEWGRRHKDLSIPFLVDSLASNGSVYIAGLLIVAVAGLEVLGGLRAAQILLGPTNVMIAGLSMVAVPEGARSLAESPGKLRRTSIGIGSMAGAAIAAWGALVFFLPDSIGRELLGESWELGHSVLIPFTILTALNGIAIGPRTGLRVLEAAKRILGIRLVTTAIGVGLTVAGAALGGAVGAATGGAIGSLIALPIWWTRFAKTLRDPPDKRVHREEISEHVAAEVPDLDTSIKSD